MTMKFCNYVQAIRYIAKQKLFHDTKQRPTGKSADRSDEVQH